MKKILFTVFIVFFCSMAARSQTLNARFSTYFYSWERYDSISTTGNNASTTYLRGYQNLLLDFNWKKWSVNTFTQTEEDVTNKSGRGFGYRFYNFYVKGTGLIDNKLDLRLGRQWISAGAGKGTIDGLYLKLKLGREREYQVIGYGGALTPLDYEIKEYPSVKDNYSVGGQFLYYGVKNLMLGLSYNNKHRKPDAYIAPRADSVFNTKDYTVDIDSPADQTAGLDLNYTVSEKGHNIYGRAYYDVNQKKFSRGEINARFNLTKQLGFSAGYLYREPQLSYNSIFWVFSYSKNQEIEGGLDYMFNGNYNAFARVSDVFYDGASSLKFQAGVNHPAFGISFIKYSGYSGESDGVYGYLATELIKTKLTGTLSGNYSNYKISEYSTDKLDAFSGVLGLTYKPSYRFSVDAQGQFMTNRIYKSDVRFLFGVNYWLFTKL